MAWVPPKSGTWVCERCGRETVHVVDGWIRLEVYEEGHVAAARTLDFCSLCKLHVDKALRALAPRARSDG